MSGFSRAHLIFTIVFVLASLLVHNFSAAFTISSRHRFATAIYNAKTPLVAGGKRFEADPGSPLMIACQKLGLKVPTDCKKGECGRCTVTVAGNKMKACVAKVPAAPRLKSLIEKGLAVSVDN